ncbi:MAG: hypothetical protein WA956_08280 [Stenotrophomonas sp.]
MKREIKAACAGTVMLVAMAWGQDAHAQRSPWWERQKAAAENTPTAQEGTPQAAVQQPYQPYASAVRREKVEGPGYTWIEAGAARVDVDMYGIDESGNGGYLRGSLAITDDLYLFGGYDRVSKSWSADAERGKVTIDQAEIGLGASISLSRRVDFTTELSLLRLGGELDYTARDYPEDDVSGSDYLYAGKLMLGIRARPVSRLELWAKAGYLRVDESWLIDDSAVGNVGIQYRFTPNWGVVGEAEFYEDVRFYRLGVRASF